MENRAQKREAWRVTRRFEGGRGPEKLLRALIRAHRS